MAKKKLDYASMFTLRKDGRYQAKYKDANDEWHTLIKRDPEALFHALEAKKLAIATEVKTVPTFGAVAGAWENQHREEIEIRTWKNYEPHYKDIVQRFGKLPFPDVEPGDIVADLARAKAKGLSRTVVQSRRSIWRMIYDYAIISGVAKYNPVTSIKLPKGLKAGKRTGPTSEQMQVIFRNVDATFGLFPFLLLCTGLRKSEALALQWSDVDLKGKTIHVTKSIDYTNGANPKYKAPKTEAGTRTVKILDVLAAELKTAKSQATSIYLFPQPATNRGGKGGGLMTDRAYETAWAKYCATVGLIDADGTPTLTAHQLRHGTATLMFELGVDELTAQKALGHSRVEVTREIYTDLRNAQESKSIKKLNRGVSKLVSKAAGG